MEIKYLDTVIAVADNLSYSRAAQIINCSQSSVSRQVGIVERDLGVELFNHIKGGRVELTDYGKRMLPMMREIMSGYSYLQESAGRKADGAAIPFRLGVYKGPFTYGPKEKLFTEIVMAHPEFMISVTECRKDDAIEKIKATNMDAALLYRAFFVNEKNSRIKIDDPNIKVRELFKKYPSIAMPKDHPLARKGSISFEELKYQVFIMSADISRIGRGNLAVQHDGFLRSCNHFGFTPRIKTITDTPSSDNRTAALLTNGWMYPTFLPNSMNDVDNVAFIPVEEPIFYGKYYLLTPKKERPGTDTVADSLIKILTTDDPSCKAL
ncbi:MAG: LysR family transcriptional regulator [Firmicutes bacterium]|nr:LysR family transcriptional regulator [Bacillota bacterium]